LNLEDLLADRTTEPALTNAEFAKALQIALATAQAERLIGRRRRKRGRVAKHSDLMSNDPDGLLVGADVADLLMGP
jgi:hypothetical protein